MVTTHGNHVEVKLEGLMAWGYDEQLLLILK